MDPYNQYQRMLSVYQDSSSMQGASLAHPAPHQPAQFIGNPLGANINMGEENKIYGLVIELMDPDSREAALLELSKKREQYDDLALVLWHAFGVYISHEMSVFS